MLRLIEEEASSEDIRFEIERHSGPARALYVALRGVNLKGSFDCGWKVSLVPDALMLLLVKLFQKLLEEGSEAAEQRAPN